jgi:hypothetical protein
MIAESRRRRKSERIKDPSLVTYATHSYPMLTR